MTPDYYFNFKLKKSTDVVRFFFRNTVALMVSVVLLNCNAQENNNYFPYDINNEDEKYVLPNVLAEISGLTEATNKKIYCLEDEHGVVYIYDFDKKKIVSKIKFGKDNDYEGLAMVNNELYALTSNGTLYRIDNVENKEKVKSTKISTFLKSNCDAEGLCYDKDKNRLLIACKGNAGNIEEYKHKKAIYEYDLTAKILNQQPAFLIDVKQVQKLKRTGNTQKAYEDFLSKLGKNNITFNPSGIAIHPITNEIYLLSSSGNTLLVLSNNGNVSHALHLKSKHFKQPEGIAFDSDGTMYVSNEGRGGKANIKKYKYQPNL